MNIGRDYLPGLFYALMPLELHFFFMLFYFDAGTDMDYCIISNQKP